MEFFLRISRWATFYFFIQNLAEWHPSNRKDYNALWRREFGPFSPEEEGLLERFKAIRLSYPTAQSPFEQAFFAADDPFDTIKEKIPAQEFKTIARAFSAFEKYFNVLYRSELPKLQSWQNELEKKLNNSSPTEKIIRVLSALYNTQPSVEIIHVYLLPSTPNHTGGGANINEKSISVEISRYPLSGADHAAAIVWHETIHLVFEKQYFVPLLNRLHPTLPFKGLRINEIAAGSLFPRGILANQFFGVALADQSYWGEFSDRAHQFFTLMKEYVAERKALDQTYVERLMALINE